MLRNNIFKKVYDLANKTRQINRLPLSHQIYFKATRHYSNLDNYLGRLRYPLYYYLIGANVGIYLAWQSSFIPQQFLIDHFTLNPYNQMSWRQHTLITYSFSHNSLLSLGLNMFTLYFFGRGLEQRFGSKALLQLYIGGAVISGLLSYFTRNSSIYLGAQPSITAMLTFYILNFPHETIFLYFIPVPAWVVGGLMLLQGYLSAQNQLGFKGYFGGLFAGLVMFGYSRGKFF